MHAKIGPVQNELLSIMPIVDNQTDASLDADQELLEHAMGMLASDLGAGDIKDNEISFGLKWELIANLSNGQIPPHIRNVGQLV